MRPRDQGLEAVRRRLALLKLLGRGAADSGASPHSREGDLVPTRWAAGSKDTTLGPEGPEGAGTD